jgi:lipopolysaccharide transport protein LptA
MAGSNLKALALAALAMQTSVAFATHMQQQGIDVDVQSTELDLKTNNMILHKVRITQGNSSIAADQAQGNGLNFDNSHWIFRGNVKIAMDQGQLSSDEADITFANKLISKAVVNGKPAAFEQRMAKTGKLVQGHSESIDYDVTKAVVRFSKNAWLSDGQNEIRGESLKYNILAQSVAADAADQGNQRVHIIITPPANSKP